MIAEVSITMFAISLISLNINTIVTDVIVISELAVYQREVRAFLV